MKIGLISDLAVGVHPGGADAWANRDLLVRGMSVGAPPDEFNQRGQGWAQPPLNPHQLVRTGGKPFADLLNAAFRHSGGLRVDHVMGLMRLWWIPGGLLTGRGRVRQVRPPADGRHARGGGGQHQRAGDRRGSRDGRRMDPPLPASQHILGTEMAWFARQPDGTPKPPASWRKQVMATVGTHDVPPMPGCRPAIR